MGDTNTIKLNTLPAATFRWLRMNDASCRVGTIDGSLEMENAAPMAVPIESKMG